MSTIGKPRKLPPKPSRFENQVPKFASVIKKHKMPFDRHFNLKQKIDLR